MICYIGLGTNLGDRIKNLRGAIELVKKFYQSEPWGVDNQPKYLNAAIKISCEFEPPDLLDELQRIEKIFGAHKHWEPRIIDLDILFIEGVEIFSERLTVPHKLLYERDFALMPLKEIFPAFICKLHGDKILRAEGSPADFKFKLVACVDKNFGLGYENKLLFRIPADLKRFRELTLNHTIIYGRKTLATLPNQKPLAGRRNIILSRTLEKISGAEVVGSVAELFDKLSTSEKNFVIGGGQIFNELIPCAEEIYLTAVKEDKLADVFFPDVSEFKLAAAENFGGYEFRRYTR